MLGIAAWAVLMSTCRSASKWLGLLWFWLQWEAASTASLALLFPAIYYVFVPELFPMRRLWAVGAALVVGYVAQWYVLRQQFRSALLLGAFLLVVGSVAGVLAAVQVSYRIESWAYESLSGGRYQWWPEPAISGAIGGALYGAISGIALITQILTSAAPAGVGKGTARASETDPDYVFCPTCGLEQWKENKTCPKCGAPIKTD
jgi:hypothetical protein